VTLQDLCKKYNVRFKKSLGQNILLDDSIHRIMVDAASVSREDYVVEVGAGLGALTHWLSLRAGRVLAVEIDPAFLPCLEERFGHAENVRLFRGDILNHDLADLLTEHLPGGIQHKMVSNIPYYITTPILFHFWESPVPFSCIVVMLQEEIALRLLASVNTPEYGILTLAAQCFGQVEIIRKVPRTCFRPMPTVDSCIVRFRRYTTPPYPDLDRQTLTRLIRAAFAHRRKMLRNNFKASAGFGISPQKALQALEIAQIDPQRRAQTLSLDEFASVARALKG
jgi:16S rRNA (adenine1518-N6/adenine1519-N6)-dimethyltransferase